jgi:hypothetical protein
MVGECQITKEELLCAEKKAQERAQSYFEGRGNTEHSIAGLKQLISNAATGISLVIQGGFWSEMARDPMIYLADRMLEIDNSNRLDEKRKAEHRLALELIAEELKIKADVLQILVSKQGFGIGYR